MSDIANFIVGQSFEHDSDEENYYPYGECAPAAVKRITCNRCGRKDLHWLKTNEGWRTAEGGEIHVCNSTK